MPILMESCVCDTGRPAKATLFLVVNYGEPEFHFGVHLDMYDGLQPEHPHQPTLPSQPPQADHDGVGHSGSARKARNRLRAAAHQTVKASAADSAFEKKKSA
jgi:hypothetical protein